MEITFGFRKTGLDVALPEHLKYEILRAHAAGSLPNPALAIEQALDKPLTGSPLRELARGRKTAAISVCDITRPAPNPLTLPPILKTLHEAGMRDADITLCIATGLHRQTTREELSTILSPTIAARYPVVNHYIRLSGGMLPIDGLELKNVVIVGTTVTYDGGPVSLDNVVFVNCKFVATPRKKNSELLAYAVLAPERTTLKTS